MFKKKHIYLDYAAATPMDEKVFSSMKPFLIGNFGNPSAIYKSGVVARKNIEDSRKMISNILNVHSDEIFFTGSATESCAIAIVGIIKNYKNGIPHIITTDIEHGAVIENCKMLEREGLAELTVVPVLENGIVDVKKIKDAVKENTLLISVMYANNEIGTIQPIQEIAKLVRFIKKDRGGDLFFHTDATQAINYLPINNIEKLGVDLLSFNSSKIYGPKGLGVLFKKRNVMLGNIYGGGGQEHCVRSGTENVASIVGCAKAFEITENIKIKEIVRLIDLRDYLIDSLLALNDSFNFKISLNGDKDNRLPNNVNIKIDGISSELLVIELDSKGIEVSERSACRSEEVNTENNLRITLGRNTKKKDLDVFLFEFKNILKKYSNWK